jgi:ribosomal protein S18 acetylase RimI-like enzyme
MISTIIRHDDNKILEIELLRYGITHRNAEYYTRKEDFDSWYRQTLKFLTSLEPPLKFADHLGCYAKILQYLESACSNPFRANDSHSPAIKKVLPSEKYLPNHEPYSIDFLKPVDLGRYLALAHDFLRKSIHVGIEDKQEFIEQTSDTARELMADYNTILLVAQKQDNFIGYLTANIHPALHINGRECMIRELYVKEMYRKQGIASSLVNTLEELVSGKGAKRISLATNMGDEIQNSFYSSLGYARRCDFAVKYLGDKDTH